MADNNLIFPSESEHPDAKLEWWYFHGSFKNPDLGQWHFMLTVFKTRPENSNFSNPGYSLILSLTNRQTGENTIISKIDKTFFQCFLDVRDEALNSNIDQGILKIIFEEYKRSGPPEPIQLSSSEIIIRNSPFEFCWDSIRIIQEKDSFSLLFEITNHGEYHLKLFPSTQNCRIPKLFKNNLSGSGMEYSFYPELNLTGTAAGELVEGTAWMDHQWGDYSWLLNENREKIILGWDWLGINLDNGTNLLIIAHKNAQTQETISRYIYYQKVNEKSRIIAEFEIIPVRLWESPETMIKYPIEIQVKIPELSAELNFNPFFDNQEIPFFGPLRAIWQGAGCVEGNLNGNKVKGEARVELNGYGYLFDFNDYLTRMAINIDKIIEGFLPKEIKEKHIHKFAGPPSWKYEPEAYGQILAKPVWDLISRKGKKWRPIFARFLLGALGINPAPYEELLYSITELNHTGSLIIDDIEDNSLIWRGEETIHMRYGNDLAINAANTLYFLPSLLLFEHPKLNKNQKLEIYELITRGFVKGHLGQGLDLYWSKNMNITNLEKWMQDSIEPKLLQMYAFKTAVGIEGLAEIAVIIAKQAKKVRRECKNFATALGVAFQIVDDIHNFNDSGGWKKTCGEDLKEGKLTYAIYHSLVECGQEDRSI